MEKYPILKKRVVKEHNTAGIIPVAGSMFRGGLHLPVNPCLMPIGRHLNLIEHAVMECLIAGCKAVWIVCTDPMEPILRACVGEYYDVKDGNGREKPVKRHIYYLPLSRRDMETRKCSVGWSILYGATAINYMAQKFSFKVLPDRFYVSFPLAIGSLSQAKILRQVFKRQRASNKNILLCSPQNTSVIDNEPVNFSFCRKSLQILQENYETLENAGQPIHELRDIFKPLSGRRLLTYPASFYYYINSWNKYLEFCRTSAARHISQINYHPRMLDEGYRVVGENDD